jgi:signal transduction histidine kinase/CheY-like chemotaxis protein
MNDEDERARRTALENARAIGALEQKVSRELVAAKDALEQERRVLEILNRTGALLASKLDRKELVQAVTDAATELTGAKFGAFFYTAPDPSGGVFTLYTLSGAPREAFERFGHPRATPLFGPTFEGRGDVPSGVIRIGNVKKDPRYGQWPPHHGQPAGDLPVVSYLAIPVTLRSGEVIGGLFFGHDQENVFTEQAERVLVGVAAQAGIAIDNVRLYEEAIQAAAERLRLLEAERDARAEVERVSLMKDEFLSTLSHELRTPLNAVLGWADMLASRAPNDDANAELRRGLEVIGRNARAQAQLIDDLLDMSRIISGKLRLDVQQLDLAALVEIAIESVGPSVEAKGIRLRKTIDPLTGPVFGDPNRVQQIVWNLLSNAVKFTPKGGKIDVLLQRINSHVEITISDSGIGIDLEFLPHIFERFRQADASTTRKYGGLGLGLSIVKQLVDLHGGTVVADSAGPGAGTSFTITLPVRAVREQRDGVHPTSPSPSRNPYISLDGVTVLIVDDAPDARDMLASVLVTAGADVVKSPSAEDALRQLADRRFDAIVSDIGMPDQDGYELMRAIRKLAPDLGGKTPAVALTAFARSEDRTRALLSGYQVHIAKPIEPHELVVTIGSLTGRTG